MSVDTLRVESNERVDISDFDFISESVQAHERQIMDNLMCDPARTRKWVVSGFAMDCPAGKQLRVTKGKAILAARTGGVVHYGSLVTEGDATLIVDLNSYSPGTYGVYIRFEGIAGESQSRIFWNPAGAGSEYAQAINTRYTAAWGLRVESTSPGAEWLKIGEVDQATLAPATTGITDQRELYFEGAVDASYESGWSTEGGGIANDRNADRATYGVTDFQMAFAAVRQCLTDLKGRGLREWYEVGIGGMNVGFDADPVEDILAVGDANFHMDFNSGDPVILFDATDSLTFTRGTSLLQAIIGGTVLTQWSGSSFYPGGAADTVNLGTAGQTWLSAHITELFPGTADDEGCNGNWNPSDDDTHDLGSATREWRNLRLDGTAFIDVLSLSTTAAEGVSGHLLPTADLGTNLGDSASGLGSGTDRRMGRCYMRSLQIQDGTTNLVHYAENGPLDEKFYRWQADNGGTISLDFLDDAYANPQAALSFSRTAEVPLSMNTPCRFTATYDSGHPATPYAPAVRVAGTNPYLHFDDADTGINAAHRDWGFVAFQGTGDAGVFQGLLLDAAGTSEYAWLQVETPTGANTLASFVYLNAYEQITLTAGPGTNNVVAISADGGTGPASSGDLGLTSDWFLGAAGASFSIVGVTGATPRTSTGFLKIFANGVDRYVPFFDNYNG